MRRVPDKCPNAPERAFEASRKWTSRTYKISLVTPLFGGGPTPGENDPVTLIRGSSIRGHLRFWWRATCGASFGNVDQLRKREGEIWGTAESPSPVVVRVAQVAGHRTEDWQVYQKKLHPAVRGVLDLVTRDLMRAKRLVMLTTSASFDLIISWPSSSDLDKDIEAAVWAWVNFGGLGARTRRGCGSLYCGELSPAAGDVRSLQQWYRRHLELYSIQPADDTRPWPTLPEQLLIWYDKSATRPLDPLTAWSKSISILSSFRQGLGIGRKRKEDGRPGRSFWPEADSLRRLTGWSLPTHKNPTTTQENAFPRAEFGLPIIFHFKDGPGTGKKGRPGSDPADCRLLPSGETERMASPLILKPLAVGPNQAVPMILQLRTPPLSRVIVKFDDTGREFGSDKIRRPDLALYHNSPMRNRSKNGSALEAFLAFAREGGFE